MKDHLTAEERSRPYSKYYDRKMAKPDPKKIKIAESLPMVPQKALPIERINDLLDPGYHEMEDGFCVMPDGTGYMCLNTKMAGVTFEMVSWWMIWSCLESLRYKIWDHEDHVALYATPESYHQVVDPKLSYTEKLHNVTHIAVENVGTGLAEMHLTFLSPEAAGFDISRFTGANKGIIGANTVTMDQIGGNQITGCGTLIHFIREIEGGIEYRTRAWLGYQIIDKKPVNMLPPNAEMPIEPIKGLFLHNNREYSNLRSFLPDLYAEESRYSYF